MRDFATLQKFCFPEIGLSEDTDMYFQSSGAVEYADKTQSLSFGAGGVVTFDSYFNLFNLTKWIEHCKLEHLQLCIWGQGDFDLEIYQSTKEQSSSVLIQTVHIKCDEGAPATIDLAIRAFSKPAGVVFAKISAKNVSRIDRLVWETHQKPLRRPNMAFVITTFKREEAIQKTVLRFQDFIEDSDLREDIKLLVVDNGSSAKILENHNTKKIDNLNLGGSGGYARGLIEAKRAGASHCLFMDDDASIHFECVERTWTFLAYSIQTGVAVAGALSYGREHWKIWENGAVFRGVCVGHFRGLDLRDPDEAINMEIASSQPQAKNFYGGWWFFAFAISDVRHFPFPFFVRGDDISFCIANKFTIVPLPGVVSFQDENFEEKESPLFLYLDIRHHLVHHLTLPSLNFGHLHMSWVAFRFGMRALIRCHYETIEALCMGLEDVQKGPAFFTENPDLIERREAIAKLVDIERLRDIPVSLPPIREKIDASSIFVRLFMRLSINGHLIPYFTKFANHIVIDADNRGEQNMMLGASEITYLDVAKKRYYTVRHDKNRAFQVGRKFMVLLARLLLDRRRLLRVWREGYTEITRDEKYWRSVLNIDATEPKSKI